eukprot:gene4321-5408_t
MQSPNSFDMITSSGIMMNNLGNFDQCLSLPKNVSQYCFYQSTYYGYTYFLGLCLPAICSKDDVLGIIEMGIDQHLLFIPPNSTDTEIHLYTTDHRSDKVWSRGTTAMIVISSFFALLIVIGTTLDWLYKYIEEVSKKDLFLGDEQTLLLVNAGNFHERGNGSMSRSQDSIIVQILMCFSLIKNYNSYINGSSAKKYLDSLDGIRSLSMIWVVLGHSILFLITFGVDNISYVFNTLSKTFSFQVYPAGEFAVDIFFNLSGFLVTYSVLDQLDKLSGSKATFGSLKFWGLYIVHRIVRLSPLYYYLMFFFMYLAPQIGNGPAIYQYQDVAMTNCSKYWWANLLYINNMTSEMANECFGWAWYLANDMQVCNYIDTK